jgi:hypothetical protein
MSLTSFFNLFLVVLGIEFKVLCLLGKDSLLIPLAITLNKKLEMNNLSEAYQAKMD